MMLINFKGVEAYSIEAGDQKGKVCRFNSGDFDYLIKSFPNGAAEKRFLGKKRDISHFLATSIKLCKTVIIRL